MLAVIQPDDWAAWLGKGTATDEPKSLLKPFDGDWDMAREKNRKRDSESDLF